MSLERISDGLRAGFDFINQNSKNELSGVISGAAGAATGAVVGNYVGDMAAAAAVMGAIAFPPLATIGGVALVAAPTIGTVTGGLVGYGVDALFKKVIG